MNLTLSFIFAALLVLIGAPRSLLNDNSDKIVACAEDAGTLAFAEAMENWNDAHTWDVMGRGTHSRVITDLNQPWGTSDTCTSCGKCVQVCPTGALSSKGKSVAEMVTRVLKADEVA